MTTILSFDVGLINLSYCILTRAKFNTSDPINNNEEFEGWSIIEWTNIDLTNRVNEVCHVCKKKASLSNIIDNSVIYYCKIHARNIDIEEDEFDNCFKKCNNQTDIKMCIYKGTCNKKGLYNNCNEYYCGAHAKLIHKNNNKNKEIKIFKKAGISSINFDDIKYKIISELDKRKHLLNVNYVVIENQPAMKNPRMKSIASTIYDYYLIRGIFDKNINNSNIIQVKFQAPSNKLKLINDGDKQELIKLNNNEQQTYKLTKSLSIKYCIDLIKHLPEMTNYFNSNKKKDDLADSFLQGVFFYTRNAKKIT
jgi:hypothetical protein